LSGSCIYRLRGHLNTERVSVFALDAEHIAVDDHRVTAAERLRDVRLLAFHQGDFSAYGHHRGFDVAGQVNGLVLIHVIAIVSRVSTHPTRRFYSHLESNGDAAIVESGP
jgi:hypothetical protein